MLPLFMICSNACTERQDHPSRLLPADCLSVLCRRHFQLFTAAAVLSSDWAGGADVVYAQAVLHLFGEGEVKAYAETAKALVKPGGLFMGANATSEPPGALGKPTGSTGLAPWLYSPAGFKAVLEGAGYENVRIETSTFSDFIRRRGFGQTHWDMDMSTILGDSKRHLIWATWSATRPSSSGQVQQAGQ